MLFYPHIFVFESLQNFHISFPFFDFCLLSFCLLPKLVPFFLFFQVPAVKLLLCLLFLLPLLQIFKFGIHFLFLLVDHSLLQFFTILRFIFIKYLFFFFEVFNDILLFCKSFLNLLLFFNFI